MHTKNYNYQHGKLGLQGYLAFDDLNEAARPAVIVAHDWSGRNEFACQKAEMFAKMGYVGFAIDLYGEGQTTEKDEQKQALMQPLIMDRPLLLDRIRAGLDLVSALPEVDKSKIAIMGFCFGGLCALDLARSGAELVGAISVHGILSAPNDTSKHPIKAKILALHGYDDPMVPPDAVHAFCQEMTVRNADWQVNMYGHTSHAFTNPKAHNPEKGLLYQPHTTRRAMQAVTDFLEEIF